MSSAIEGLLNIAVTANINTANITVVSLKPLEDDLFIFIPAFQLCPNFITCFSTKFTQRLLQVLLHPKMQLLQCCVFFFLFTTIKLKLLKQKNQHFKLKIVKPFKKQNICSGSVLVGHVRNSGYSHFYTIKFHLFRY